MQNVVSVNPFRCRMWAHHDRMSEHITAENCKDEIASFLKQGQLLPVLGRRLVGDADYEMELIYGARRLFVARHINKPLLVELRTMDDREAIIAMDIENRQRTDISAYERGVGYARWMSAGYFKTQEEIAKALKISPSQVSRHLKLARLPAIIVDAFVSPMEICEGWGVDIVDALDDPIKRAPTVKAARAICAAAVRPPAKEVYRLLLSAAAQGKKPKPQVHDEVVKDCDGNPLFRIRHQSDSIAVLLPRERISAKVLAAIRENIAGVLRPPSPEAVDRSRKVTLQIAGGWDGLQARRRGVDVDAKRAAAPPGP